MNFTFDVKHVYYTLESTMENTLLYGMLVILQFIVKNVCLLIVEELKYSKTLKTGLLMIKIPKGMLILFSITT